MKQIRPKFTKPTVAIKHQKVLEKLTENGGNLSKAIRDTGLYSEEVATNPKKITSSKTWGELMETHLSDEKLSKKHNELLNSVSIRQFTFDKNDADDVIYDVIGDLPGHSVLYIRQTKGSSGEPLDKVAYVRVPDAVAQDKALDKAYKLKGKYVPEQAPPAVTNYNLFFDQRVQVQVKQFEDNLKSLIDKDVPKTQEGVEAKPAK